LVGLFGPTNVAVALLSRLVLKQDRARAVVRALSFEVKKGEVVGFSAPNGRARTRASAC
jgi:ABC-type lipopolysaccharide export system ATPase subunit